jgi:sulfite exporter TauE/SafE
MPIDFVSLIRRNLGRGLLGIWLVGMGIIFWVNPADAGVRNFLNIVMGVILIAAGVCTLLNR